MQRRLLSNFIGPIPIGLPTVGAISHVKAGSVAVSHSSKRMQGQNAQLNPINLELEGLTQIVMTQLVCSFYSACEGSGSNHTEIRTCQSHWSTEDVLGKFVSQSIAQSEKARGCKRQGTNKDGKRHRASALSETPHCKRLLFLVFPSHIFLSKMPGCMQ